ncbi:MAG: LAGLIDADG family homing endonuclease [Candidatus Paceibacterota bacterium]
MGVKYSVNEKFFERWNVGMAYTLGYIYADGSLECSPSIRGKYLRITSTDKERIIALRNLMESQHKIYRIAQNTYSGKQRYLLRIGNSFLYDSLVKHGLHPKKSLTIKMPEIPDLFLKDFVRGYFDGDGCVSIEYGNGKKRQKILKRIGIIFTCGSKDFLRVLEKQLRQGAGVGKREIYTASRCYQLRYNTEDSVTLFKFLYHGVEMEHYMRRKRNIFADYFEKRPKRVDKEIKSILECTEGPVVKR